MFELHDAKVPLLFRPRHLASKKILVVALNLAFAIGCAGGSVDTTLSGPQSSSSLSETGQSASGATAPDDGGRSSFGGQMGASSVAETDLRLARIWSPDEDRAPRIFSRQPIEFHFNKNLPANTPVVWGGDLNGRPGLHFWVERYYGLIPEGAIPREECELLWDNLEQPRVLRAECTPSLTEQTTHLVFVVAHPDLTPAQEFTWRVPIENRTVYTVPTPTPRGQNGDLPLVSPSPTPPNRILEVINENTGLAPSILQNDPLIIRFLNIVKPGYEPVQLPPDITDNDRIHVYAEYIAFQASEWRVLGVANLDSLEWDIPGHRQNIRIRLREGETRLSPNIRLSVSSPELGRVVYTMNINLATGSQGDNQGPSYASPSGTPVPVPSPSPSPSPSTNPEPYGGELIIDGRATLKVHQSKVATDALGSVISVWAQENVEWNSETEQMGQARWIDLYSRRGLLGSDGNIVWSSVVRITNNGNFFPNQFDEMPYEFEVIHNAGDFYVFWRQFDHSAQTGQNVGSRKSAIYRAKLGRETWTVDKVFSQTNTLPARSLSAFGADALLSIKGCLTVGQVTDNRVPVVVVQQAGNGSEFITQVIELLYLPLEGVPESIDSPWINSLRHQFPAGPDTYNKCPVFVPTAEGSNSEAFIAEQLVDRRAALYYRIQRPASGEVVPLSMPAFRDLGLAPSFPVNWTSKTTAIGPEELRLKFPVRSITSSGRTILGALINAPESLPQGVSRPEFRIWHGAPESIDEYDPFDANDSGTLDMALGNSTYSVIDWAQSKPDGFGGAIVSVLAVSPEEGQARLLFEPSGTFVDFLQRGTPTRPMIELALNDDHMVSVSGTKTRHEYGFSTLQFGPAPLFSADINDAAGFSRIIGVGFHYSSDSTLHESVDLSSAGRSVSTEIVGTTFHSVRGTQVIPFVSWVDGSDYRIHWSTPMIPQN